MYKVQEKQDALAPKVVVSETLESSTPAVKEVMAEPTQTSTKNGLAPPLKDGILTPTTRSYGRTGGNTIQRGDFDQAIRGMLDGTQRRRRDNHHRPLSRIFVDGSRQSRAIE